MAEREPCDDEVAGDAALVAAMRREEPAALAGFHERFAPLLTRCAHAWGARGARRDDAVHDVLADVALALMRHTAPVPRSLAAYLVTSLRHHLGGAQRAEARRARHAEAAAPADATPPWPSHDAGAERRVGAALYSEHARRAAAGPLWAPPGAHPALAALARHLDDGLRDDDRLLLAWLAHHVPLRTAAAWLGVSYEGACKRAQRLRARLRAAALAHLATLPPAERRVVARVLARGDAPAAIAGPPPPPSAEEHP